ncbi:hypothetical protein V6N11_034080 [Hibiscus sabdariffa]|uniref:Uncharacterized protein n=1 Tax=Hibiscus sabdariffa TaxID=183260 RepID=A0ABR2S1T4_9ROSI
MGHPVKECGYNDEKHKKTGHYGPWMRAPSSKKSAASPVAQRHLPLVGASDDSLKTTGRCVENLAIEERQDVALAIIFDDTELKVSDHTRSKVDSSLISGNPCNPRTNKIFLKVLFNGSFPILCASNREKSFSHVLPLTKPTQSLSSGTDQEFNCFSSNPIEKLRVLYAWSNHLPPKPLVSPWNENFISKNFSDMEISSINKRKRDLDDPLVPHPSNKRVLRDEIFEGVLLVLA